MTSPIPLTHGARLLLRNSQKKITKTSNIFDNVFIRRIHNTKFENNLQLTSFPRSFLNNVPKNVINSNIKLGSIIIQRGLATVTAIDTKVPDPIPVLTDTKNIASEAAKVIAPVTQTPTQAPPDIAVIDAFNEKRKFYNENYWTNVNLELFKSNECLSSCYTILYNFMRNRSLIFYLQ